MPSPIAHSLAGLTIAHALAPEPATRRASWYVFAVVLANAADLDFAVGLAAGSINGCHGGPAHSLGAALGVAAISAFLVHEWAVPKGRMFLVAFALYASHILLDLACEQDPRNPGMTALWPFTYERYLFPWRPFGGILHGAPGDGVTQFLDELFTMHNLRAVGFEVAVLLPPLAVVCLVRGLPHILKRRPAGAVSAAGEVPSPK